MRHVYVMATPLNDGGAPLVGTASDVCTELWGTVKSGYPRYISRVLYYAREGGTYKGYKWQVIPAVPVVVHRKGAAPIEDTSYEVPLQCA